MASGTVTCPTPTELVSIHMKSLTNKFYSIHMTLAIINISLVTKNIMNACHSSISCISLVSAVVRMLVESSIYKGGFDMSVAKHLKND